MAASGAAEQAQRGRGPAAKRCAAAAAFRTRLDAGGVAQAHDGAFAELRVDLGQHFVESGALRSRAVS